MRNQRMVKRFLTSITRVTDLAVRPFDVTVMPREEWATGDYVECEVVGTPGPLYRVELPSGRRTPVMPGDRIVGALGRRAATHECVGDWRDIGEGLVLHQLTGAGLLGKVTSNSRWVGRPMELAYCGHAVRDTKINIADFVTPVAQAGYSLPTVLVAGTSMSAGKTLTGRIIIRELAMRGVSVVAAKLAGAAGYKDALSYADAGASHVFDYVDAGLVSTACPREDYAAGLETLLDRMARTGADSALGEIGASPAEPYNGDIALSRLAPHVKLMALCASDAYAVQGFIAACALRPDFVTGPAANNSASRALVEKLTGLPALDLGDEEAVAALGILLEDRFAPRSAAAQ